MTFFNTNNESGEELKQSRRNAITQEREIYDIFFAEVTPLTPSEVFAKMGQRCPITSVRRAMTNMTKDGTLKKTNEMRPGLYGKNEHAWMINDPFRRSKPNAIPSTDRLPEQGLLSIFSEPEGAAKRSGRN